MTPDEIGITFAPTAAGDGRAGRGGEPPTSPVAEAIKVLSLRIPRVVGPGGIAPNALLQGLGAAGLPGDTANIPGGLEALLRRLFGQGGAQTGAPVNPRVRTVVTVPGGGPAGPPPAGPPQGPPPSAPSAPGAPPGGGEDFPLPFRHG